MINIFDMLDAASGKRQMPIIKAPFGRTGGKSKLVPFLMTHLPYRNSFVDVFGGSGVVMLNRRESPNDVFNDINSGVCAVYRCLRDKEKMERLCEWIDNTIQSYEEWVFCRQTWKDVNDDVERAGRWLYMTVYSFSDQGTAYGFDRTKNSLRAQLSNKIAIFPKIHERFRTVNVENRDWRAMLDKYDTKETVFYLDPPYGGTGGYGKDNMSWDEHRELLDRVSKLKGFVAVSGYSNNIYDSADFWTKRLTTNSAVTTGNKDARLSAEEVLWIKN